jgi:archaellum component FlaC
MPGWPAFESLPFTRAGRAAMLYCASMSESDVERLTRLILDEFKGVNERLDRHDERFDRIDQRFDAIGSELHSIRAELALIRNDLDDLAGRVQNVSGFRKEIDHALEQVAAIGKHLGISKDFAV